jgi:hypothetical protein
MQIRTILKATTVIMAFSSAILSILFMIAQILLNPSDFPRTTIQTFENARITILFSASLMSFSAVFFTLLFGEVFSND